MPQIYAIVVTYEPDDAAFKRLLKALAPQVTGAIVINNGHKLQISDRQLQEAGFSVKHMQFNAGVATALNEGFQWADAQNAEFVITIDQDSEPTDQMIPSLMAAYQDLQSKGHKVGAIGPQQVDRRTGVRATFLAPMSWLRSPVMAKVGQIVEVDHLITSGCLVPMVAWTSAGKFMDELFIDYVDTEWCLRLRDQGWHLYGVGGVDLIHSMGDEIKHWRGWHIPWHKPLRHYYMIRNGMYLQQLSHIPLGWKVADGFYMLKKIIFFSLLASPRGPHIRAILSGLKDGWRRKLGNHDCRRQDV